jgi:hypothetical protein
MSSEFKVNEGHSYGDHIVLWDQPDDQEHYRELKAFLLTHLEG